MTNEINNESNLHKSPPNPADDLAGRVQQLRRRQGLSQEELANALGVSRQAVSKWESGQAQPELEKLLALSDFFQVSCDYLLKGKKAEAAPASDNAARLPVSVGQPVNRQVFVINATLFNYIGLLVSWALWDYWQRSFCALIGIVMSIIGGAVLAVGLSSVSGEDRQKLWHDFWRWNVWPIAQLGIALIYSALCTGGQLLSPIISLYFFGWVGGGLFVFCWGAWLIICLAVWRACRNK